MALDLKANIRMIKKNKYTIISLIIIMAVLYIIKNRIPVSTAKYYEVVNYVNVRYKYMDTVRGSAFSFVRAGGTKEGNIVLLRRKDKSQAIPVNIYIYAGSGRYLKYEKE